MLSQKTSEKKFSVSKWLKHQVLLDAGEMEACLEALGSFAFYNVSSIAPLEELQISHAQFLEAYQNYISDLKNGKIPERSPCRNPIPSGVGEAGQNSVNSLNREESPPFHGGVLQPDRKIFSAVATVDPESLYAKEIQPGRWMAKLSKPVIQLQHHRFFASKIDHKIHPMVMSPESIHWGLQFAYPQIFFDGSGGSYSKTSDEKQFPNAALFTKLLKWLRAESVPTTFIWDEHKVATPLRLGKACFTWIANHPQLKEQGIKVHVY